MLNIVIPMAGAGSRFAVAGYDLPKPLIDVRGVPMIRLVIANLTPQVPHRFIFICQKEHARLYGLEEKLSTWAPGSEIVLIQGLTEGAACTVLAAREFIDSDDPVMIANSDQYIDTPINAYLADSEDVDGLIMTMKASDPKWSYVGFDANGRVDRVVEKQVISDEATVGIYNFRRGRDLVECADSMIRKNLRVNNEFYVAPIYNELIEKGGQVKVYNIGTDKKGMHGLGTPEDLEEFLGTSISDAATRDLK